MQGRTFEPRQPAAKPTWVLLASPSQRRSGGREKKDNPTSRAPPSVRRLTVLGKLAQHLHLLDLLPTFLALHPVQTRLEEACVDGEARVRGDPVIVLRG